MFTIIEKPINDWFLNDGEHLVANDLIEHVGAITRIDEFIILLLQTSLHKKWSFPLRISSVNETKSRGSVHIY